MDFYGGRGMGYFGYAVMLLKLPLLQSTLMLLETAFAPGTRLS